MPNSAIGCLGKLLLGFVALIATAILLVAALCLYLLNRQYPIDHDVIMDMPSSLGGGLLPGNVSGVIEIDLVLGKSLNTTADVLLSTNHGNIRKAIPKREFSLLVDSADYPQVSSMLGRLKFVPDSATLGKVDSVISLTVRLEGEFYVRARRDYAQDEEQPGSSEPLPLGVDLIVNAKDLTLSQQWGLNGTIDVSVKLDDDTRASLDGRYGQGQDFANYVERLLNERAQNHAAKLDASGINLREHVASMIKKANERVGLYSNFGDFMVQVDKVEADACPSIDDNGNVSFSIYVQGHVEIENENHFNVPDLALRPTRC